MQTWRQTKPREWTIQALLQWATSYFQSHHIDSPRLTAEILLSEALHVRRIDLYLNYDQPLSTDELAAFKVLIKRRKAREPVAYIIGSKEFRAMDFQVSGDVLIPRPETEHLVETAFSVIKDYKPFNGESSPITVLDMGTGSGVIILSLAAHLDHLSFFASDISINALKTARFNAERFHLTDRVRFFAGNWFSALKEPGRFDMIVSNPPYIPRDELADLAPEIRQYEPHIALDGKKDGLFFIRHIIEQAPAFLKTKGFLILEIGHDQKEATEDIIACCGVYENVLFIKDYGGKDRVVRMMKN